ncbi:MAG: TrkH family potassium uptake protein [Clostridiales bacterium]|jgi:Trk-type K+ transport system membrane component|nr:TrkH family potassium uptake protein [Clostridiales bacterium]
MNYGMIVRTLGRALFIEAACMIPPLLVSLACGEARSAIAFGACAAGIAALGAAARALRPKSAEIYARDGFAIVGFGWLLMSVLGALPFFASGALPSLGDALFESVSGFSTTGASVVLDVEALPAGIVLWRSLASWLGGIGFLVLMLAISPSARANTVHILNAETPGPQSDKFVPHVGRIARILYGIYIALTLAQAGLMLLGGMSPFDAAIHALGTASTGGFSNRSMSVAAYGSAYLEAVIVAFMLLSSLNFALFHALSARNWRLVIHNEELRVYLIVMASAIALTAASMLHGSGGAGPPGAAGGVGAAGGAGAAGVALAGAAGVAGTAVPGGAEAGAVAMGVAAGAAGGAGAAATVGVAAGAGTAGAVAAVGVAAVGAAGGVGAALRYSAFHVVSISTTTGYATADYSAWPVFSQCVALLLMVIGASGGSTGGGLKCIRAILLFKTVRRECGKLVHPRSVTTVKLNGKAVDEDTLRGVVVFFFLYVAIIGAGALVVSLDGKDLVSTVTSVVACVANIGTGLGAAGGNANYAAFSGLSKFALAACMFVGRLEIYPVLLLCAPSFWKR